MYTYHPENTDVPQDLKTASFIAGFTELYHTSIVNPDFRMVPIAYADSIRTQLKQLGYRVRIRYRGPHAQKRDTLKSEARAFTVYFKSQD
jgi:hypothetical protein